MSNRYFYSLLVLLNLWSSDLLAVGTGPDANPPPAARHQAPVAINRNIDNETRLVLFGMAYAICTSDFEAIRTALEGDRVLDCLHLPGVTYRGHDVNAIEFSVLAGRHQVLRFLLTFARDNHILPSLNLSLSYEIAGRRGDAEALRIIDEFWVRPVLVGTVADLFCSIQ